MAFSWTSFQIEESDSQKSEWRDVQDLAGDRPHKTRASTSDGPAPRERLAFKNIPEQSNSTPYK